MSIDVCVRMFFPMASAPEALECLSGLLRGDPGQSLTIAIPGGPSFALPADDPDWRSKVEQEGLDRPQLLAEGASIGLVETNLTAVVRKKKRLPRKARPRVNAWGDVEDFKIVKERVDYPVWLGIRRGRAFVEAAFHNVTSSGANAFHSRPFRSRLGTLYAEGGGVAAAYVGMGEWQAFAEPCLAIEPPPEAEAPEDEQNLDRLAEQLIAVL